MSKDPNTNPPPKGAKPETLEDVVYRASLAEGNSAVRHASPFVTIPLTLVTLSIGVIRELRKPTPNGA